MMKELLKNLMLTVLLVATSATFSQASFNFTGKPTEFHPDGTLATSAPISFVMSNVPNDTDNIIRLRLYLYANGISTTDASGNPVDDGITWSTTTDKNNYYLGLINDADVNNGFYRTETIDNGNGTFTKTYTIFNVSNNGSGDTYRNGGIDDGAYYAPIIILINANGQPRYNTNGDLGTGNGNDPLIVDQATLDQSPDEIAAHLAFSYYPPEENETTGNGEFPHILANSSIDLLGTGDGSGKQNQIITFDTVGKKSTTDAPFNVSASSTSGLTDIFYSVTSGPATINGSTVTLNGTVGTVTLKAEQAGNADFNAAETFQQFEVIDLSTFSPSISTPLTEDYPLEMPAFYAYPIYVTSAIEEADLITINNIEITVDETPIAVTSKNNLHYALWTPTSYGSHTIKITAYGSNGVNTTITKTIQVTDVINTQNVKTMDDVIIEYNTTNSRNFYGTFTMPQHVGSYNQIIANLLVECPSTTGDCDNWDRRAFIDVMGPDRNWIQIIRYVTPFGVGCSHTIDLTDYASLLQGEVQFRMFIDTWGTGGWQISLDFDFNKGTPQYLYSKVDELWDGNWDLGNPDDLQPVPVANYTYDANILSSHLRLSNTGHGWGSNNSQNAAEFYHATNYIDIDGVQNYEQNLWNTCNPNPDGCSPQGGTWTYNRAGWCPGSIAPPDIVDMTSQISKGSVNFSYRFDPTYVDYCHPNNPDCVTGVTCTDCNDGYKAQYYIDGQLINFSNTPLLQVSLDVEEVNNTANYKFLAHPNPSNGIFHISSTGTMGKSVMHVVSVSGEILKTYYFNSSEEINNTTFNLSSLAKGLYFVTIENNAGQGNLKLIIK
ncbi:putative secreted protein (Por secretion system target) [Mariniflexile fucanivorans]|uniref:Putative secreted protein (Por secretion system target) n=1 Tax=Mariniflexile fucanivorans TaxID=264023 RepID=A0A4R1RHL8_9FLAO|nr:peptide-N-glycosidase F-related protein [Mariniflexile fucanivorans]TCL65575.1 putative secreted protein (Por secretion system target) [Mariniflexile fucanivorans]